MKRVPDPTLLKGKSEVIEYGEPARATSVSRKVYAADGTLLHEDTWYSQYRSEPRVLRVGAKPKPKPKKPPPKVDPLVPAKSDGVPNAPPASTPPSSPSDHLDEPGRNARRQARRRIDDRMRGVAVGNQDAFTFDRILVAEPRSAQVDAACPDRQLLVEMRRTVIPDLHLGRQRFDPVRPDSPVAAGVLGQIRNAGDLEPDHEGGMVRDPLRIRLGEADENVGREVEPLHELNSRRRGGLRRT